MICSMEFLNSTLSINPPISFLSWKSRITPSRLTLADSQKLPLCRQFSLPSRKLQISARLCRRTSRQNYLRKKLTQQQKQFHQVSRPRNPPHESIRIDVDGSEFDIQNHEITDLRDSDVVQKQESETGLRNKNNQNLGESVLWDKLQSWVEQYKKDSNFWGIGSGPIFTVYQDSEGKAERVVVNKDEILRRTGVGPRSDSETQDMYEANYKISFAEDLAMEMENGSNVIPKNSSVAKFLLSSGKSSLMDTIQSVALKPGLFSRMSRVGAFVLCSFCVIWSIGRLLAVAEGNTEYTRLEKEMLLRKIKARAEKEKIVNGSVEVLQDSAEPRSASLRRPHLDKEVLLSNIIKAKELDNGLKISEHAAYQSKGFKDKIEEVREMARHAREIEAGNTFPNAGEGVHVQAVKVLSGHRASLEDSGHIQNEIYENSDDATESTPATDPEYNIGQSTDEASNRKSETMCYGFPNTVISIGNESSISEVSNKKLAPKASGLNEVDLHFDGQGSRSGSIKNSTRKKLRIITSAKEAREYLRKSHKPKVNQKDNVRKSDITMTTTNITSDNTSKILDSSDEENDTSPLSGMHDFSHLSGNHNAISEMAGHIVSLNCYEKPRMSSGCEVRVNNNDAGMSIFDVPGEKEEDNYASQNGNYINEVSSSFGAMAAPTSTKVDFEDANLNEEAPIPPKNQNSEDDEKNVTVVGLQVSETASSNEAEGTTAELSSVNKENWVEKNFHEFEPIVEKIGIGFRENYLVAREKANQELDSAIEIMKLKSDDADNELQWMKDETLRDIVFKVRDNELSGRDPFHCMEEEDKSIFFHGLEQKVEEVNAKLLNLHEYFHSNIENLDYGADGISLYDLPEKIIPRWKVPPAEKNPVFLEKFLEQRKALSVESLKTAFPSDKAEKLVFHKSGEPCFQNNVRNISGTSTKLQKGNSASSKTIIEGSDCSIRKGKKSGKEFWQHTKKWSQGFLESYNSETDPEVKAVMKDIGKDLDRWITEKEIQEAATLMDKLPEKGRKFVERKLNKVKREMELFGPQAVVSKYREYAEEKEEDYLWWLDLPFVLCIELYTIESGEQRVGFYSLEMAADLELDPKQYHVIAFEDACDCKNLCYIIQARMEMLSNGNAFLVARPPKDAFREAKTNGFSITVIRKGQLQLNIDQTLEEVEESIIEIGSKVYQEKSMKERGVDISALMKGVFGISKQAPSGRKRSKRKLKRRIEP